MNLAPSTEKVAGESHNVKAVLDIARSLPHLWHRNRTVNHPIYKVCSLKIIGPCALKVGFDDGTEQAIDFRPVLAGELYRPLRDLAVFNQVRIDPEVRTLVWPNGADFDPATLHDWPDHISALTACAREWDSQPA